MPDASPVADFELARLLSEFPDYEVIPDGLCSFTASPLAGVGDPVTAGSLTVLREHLRERRWTEITGLCSGIAGWYQRHA